MMADSFVEGAMANYIASGAVLGALIMIMGIGAKFVGATGDQPGQALVSVFGIEVDRVEVPPGTIMVPDRIASDYLMIMIAAGALGLLVGGFLGWMVAKWKRRTRSQRSAGSLDLMNLP
jgi:hypothetical protein